jgi:hypothetical protein
MSIMRTYFLRHIANDERDEVECIQQCDLLPPDERDTFGREAENMHATSFYSDAHIVFVSYKICTPYVSHAYNSQDEMRAFTQQLFLVGEIFRLFLPGIH